MAFPQKGTRKIIVDEIDYAYRVSKVKAKSGWRAQNDELDSTFVRYARYYGLGMVKDATINVAVQLATDPNSGLYVKFHTLLVDGFMGPEQIIDIKPNQVSSLIQLGLEQGWNPEAEVDLRLEFAQQQTPGKAPVILQLPNMNEDLKDYENLEKPIEIQLDSPEE